MSYFYPLIISVVLKEITKIKKIDPTGWSIMFNKYGSLNEARWKNRSEAYFFRYEL